MQKTAAAVPGALLARETASAHPVRGGPIHVCAQEDRRGTLQILNALEELQGPLKKPVCLRERGRSGGQPISAQMTLAFPDGFLHFEDAKKGFQEVIT